MKRLLSYAISVSANKSRSAMVSGQEPKRPSAAIRSSSAFFSTSARKLQNTWPRMVSSSLWKIGLVESRCLAVRKVCSTTTACSRAWPRAGEVGIGAQHKDAVELVVLRDLVGINREVLVADRLQVTAVAGVADQRLVALGELALQRGDDGSTIGGVLLGLLMIAADDVASTGQHHGLGLVVGLLAALVDGQRHERRGILEHQLAHQLVAALAHAENVQEPASSSATVSALIIPRSATTHTRAMAKRRRSRSITGISACCWSPFILGPFLARPMTTANEATSNLTSAAALARLIGFQAFSSGVWHLNT